MFEVCVVSVGEIVAVSLLLMANSALNPLVNAFLKRISREKQKLCFAAEDV